VPDRPPPGCKLLLLSAAGLLAGCTSFPRLTSPPVAPPPGATFLTGAGGVRLYARVEGDGARGVVWFVLGPETGSAPLYPRLVAALHGAGLATAAIHLRGTGWSDGLRGDIDDYALVLADLRLFRQRLGALFPGRPPFLLGQSAGAALALELSASDPSLAGVVLVNPAYKLRDAEGMRPTFGDYLAYAANAVFRPSALVVDMNRDPSVLRDPADRAEGEALQRDPLVVRYFSLRYLLAQKAVMDRAAKNAAATAAPFLLVQGARDELVDPGGNDELLAAVPGADKRRLVAPDAGHGSSAVETMVEPLLAWLVARAAAPATPGSPPGPGEGARR